MEKVNFQKWFSLSYKDYLRSGYISYNTHT